MKCQGENGQNGVICWNLVYFGQVTSGVWDDEKDMNQYNIQSINRWSAMIFSRRPLPRSLKAPPPVPSAFQEMC